MWPLVAAGAKVHKMHFRRQLKKIVLILDLKWTDCCFHLYIFGLSVCLSVGFSCFTVFYLWDIIYAALYLLFVNIKVLINISGL